MAADNLVHKVWLRTVKIGNKLSLELVYVLDGLLQFEIHAHPGAIGQGDYRPPIHAA